LPRPRSLSGSRWLREISRSNEGRAAKLAAAFRHRIDHGEELIGLVVRSDGELRVIRYVGVPVFENDIVTRFIGTLTGITLLFASACCSSSRQSSMLTMRDQPE
jgi:hypothetical protein